MSSRMWMFGFTLLAVGAPAPGAALQAVAYTSSEVAPGVHVFEPNDQGFGNVVAVISEGEALVVDATATPAAAQAILEDLRVLGVDRVTALVNTHWHDDHVWGNQVFTEAFPGLAHIAHPATIDGMREQAIPALAGQLERLQQTIADRTRQLETGISADGTPLDDEARTNLENRQALFIDAVASLETVTPVLPSTVVSVSQGFQVGELNVLVEHVGAGHTPGDLIVSVPQRGVVVVGDLITHPVPAAAEVDLPSWIDVLDSVDGMTWDVLILGHGAPQRDRTYLREVTALFRAVVDYVVEGRAAGTTADDLVEAATFNGFRERWLGDEPRTQLMFDAFFLEPAIRGVYSGQGG